MLASALTDRSVRSARRLEELPEVAVLARHLVHGDVHRATAAVHHDVAPTWIGW